MAGGLHPEAKAKYFRVGHMGVMTAADILAAVGALERALVASGYRFEPGVGVGTAQRIWRRADKRFGPRAVGPRASRLDRSPRSRGAEALLGRCLCDGGGRGRRRRNRAERTRA